MSKHRDAVTQLVDRLVARTAAAMTEDVAERLHTSGANVMHLDLMRQGTVGAAFADDLISDLQDLLARGPVGDLRGADITIQLSVGRRNAVCATTTRSTGRVMCTGRFVITPRIQTRWVHMWRDFVKDVQWLQT